MKTLSLFQGFGVELEYMIVKQDDLSIFPISDQLIHDITGQFIGDVVFEDIAWSNELVLHVIELKTNGPVKSLQPLPTMFQHHIQTINNGLKKYDAMLLPSGAHPKMKPEEAQLWPHDNNIIYETYDRIFNCHGHGWSNLQSSHLNLPFANDEEFAKLHSAIRLLLPIIPALSASTPIVEGKLTGMVDTRLEYYRNNQKKIPFVTGFVVPEVVLSQKEYEEKILKRMYRDISSFDTQGILQEEWLNSRGAIARFDRNTIEIRIIDSQECAIADLAIMFLIIAVLKSLIDEKWITFEKQIQWNEERLAQIFQMTIKEGMSTIIDDIDYVKNFGYGEKCTLNQLWSHLVGQVIDANSLWAQPLNHILREGNLSERIIKVVNKGKSIDDIYRQLALCLQKGALFSYNHL